MRTTDKEVVRTMQEIASGFASAINERIQTLEDAAKAEDSRCTCLGLTFSNTGHAAWCPVTTEVANG